MDIKNHTYKILGELVQKRISALKIGQKMQDLPEELWHDSFKKYFYDENRCGGPNMRLIRLNPDEPSLTVTGYIYNKFIHPYENRYITVREAARLQGFPDNIEFQGTLTSTQMQVGNAVPIYLATAVLSSFCKYFSQIAPKKKNINALSLFCGAGGMDIGADNASYKNVRIKTRLSSDIWEDACQSLKTYYKNVNNSTSNVITADISKIDNPTEFWKQNTKSVELDMIYGGPPCQAFSQAGKQKGTNDIRGTMVFQYLRVVGDLKPKAFLIENVSNLKGINGGQIMRDILKLIDELGYNCNVQLLSAHHYGAPQKRKRIFFMCSQKGTPSVETPKETNYDGDMYALPFNTVAKAFSGLPPATCISEDK